MQIADLLDNKELLETCVDEVMGVAVTMTAPGISDESVQSLTSAGTNEKPDSTALEEVVARLKQLQIESSPVPGTRPNVNFNVNINNQDEMKLMDKGLKNTSDAVCPVLPEDVKSNILKAQVEAAVKVTRDDTRLNDKNSNLFNTAFRGLGTADTILLTSKIAERQDARSPLKNIPACIPFASDGPNEREVGPNSEVPMTPSTSAPTEPHSDLPALKNVAEDLDKLLSALSENLIDFTDPTPLGGVVANGIFNREVPSTIKVTKPLVKPALFPLPSPSPPPAQRFLESTLTTSVIAKDVQKTVKPKGLLTTEL